MVSHMTNGGYQRHTVSVPNEPLVRRLLDLCNEDPNAITVYDHATQLEATRERLLLDILTVRDAILDGLDDDTRSLLPVPGEDVLIGILIPASYQFAVAYLAINALGAGFVPFSPAILPEEAKTFIQLSNAAAVVTTKDMFDRAASIEQVTGVKTIVVDKSLGAAKSRIIADFQLDTSPPLDPHKAGSILFTSGTSGFPKGVMHTRESIHLAAQINSEADQMSTGDRVLHYVPMFWVGGLNIFNFSLYGGACVELCSTVFSPAWFWDRMKVPGVTYVGATPPLLGRLAKYFEAERTELLRDDEDKCIAGVRNLRRLHTGSAPLPEWINDYWNKIRAPGILNKNYGATETFHFMLTQRPEDKLKHNAQYLGVLTRGSSTTVADGEEGDFCIKCPSMFKRYISANPRIMDDIFDENGFYRTGDVVRREGDGFFFIGRASQDVIRFSGYKVRATEVEDAILRLRPCPASEVMVFSVNDEECHQRVAAVVRLTTPIEPPLENLLPETTSCLSNTANAPQETATTALDLATLRRRLALECGLPIYELPTLLRVLDHQTVMPTTKTGKVRKATARQLYFSAEHWKSSASSGANGDSTSKVEVWELGRQDEGVPARPWDWVGIRS